MPPVIVILGLARSRCRDGGTRTSERDARKDGIAPDVNKMIAVIPRAATTNNVVDGISNSVAAAGAVRATVKNAIADSGIASLRWTRNPISYPHSPNCLMTARLTPTSRSTFDAQPTIDRSSSRDWQNSHHLTAAST